MAVNKHKADQRQARQACIWFWHNASSDFIGTCDPDWVVVESEEVAPGYFTEIWRRVGNEERQWADWQGGELVVTSHAGLVDNVTFYNGRVPKGSMARLEDEVYDDHGEMMWNHKATRDEERTVYSRTGGSKFMPAGGPKKPDRTPRPENFGSWS